MYKISNISSQFLIENGSYLNAKDKYGLTALHHAAIRGNRNAIIKLLAVPGVEKEVSAYITPNRN